MARESLLTRLLTNVMPRRATGMPRRWDGPVERYLVAHGVREPVVAAHLRVTTAALPHASMQISPEQGQFMALLAQAIGARRAIEIGTYTGYSALWVALALPPDGCIVCCDITDEWPSIGKPFWAQAGVAGKIDLRIAPAKQTLDGLLAAGEANTYDLAFIDADKMSYDTYYEQCLKLLRPGGMIVIDNVLWGGDVADPREQGGATVALRALNDKIHRDERVAMAMLAVGDGLTLALKRQGQRSVDP